MALVDTQRIPRISIQ